MFKIWFVESTKILVLLRLAVQLLFNKQSTAGKILFVDYPTSKDPKLNLNVPLCVFDNNRIAFLIVT